MITRSVRDTASREESLNNRPRTASAQMLSERPEIVHAALYIRPVIQSKFDEPPQYRGRHVSYRFILRGTTEGDYLAVTSD